ncbi:MAG: hypothetical protein J6Y02_00875 [Pseudobutyrivibrio sp.]|nr:hypothetical protein [Pseudobutyrivibrio sp.]
MIREDQLQHSAKGTHWSKKNHKYLRKEGNRYIYADVTTQYEHGGGGSHKREALTPYEKELRRKATVHRLNAEQERLNKIAEVNKRLDAAEQANRKQAEYKRMYRYYEQQEAKKKKDAIVAQKAKQAEYERMTKDRSVDRAKRINQITKAKRDAEQAKKAEYKRMTNRNRSQANNSFQETVNRRKEAVRRSQENLERSGTKGQTARDLIKKQGVDRVEYKDERGYRYRNTYNKGRRKVSELISKSDSPFKKKLSEIKLKFKNPYKNWHKIVKQESKARRQEAKERDRQLPAEMRRKRNWKRFKRKLGL